MSRIGIQTPGSASVPASCPHVGPWAGSSPPEGKEEVFGEENAIRANPIWGLLWANPITDL